MRNNVFGAMLASFFFAASPALATIIANLETPENLQDTSGITLIRGTAFSTLGAPVTVTLRVNGIDTGDVLPCCSSRVDVQVANPGAPLNTGFGTQINYGVFDPATLNSIGVRITAPNEPDVVIDHQVMVVKPGNAEFLNNFLLGTNANIAIDVNDIVIGGAQVISGGTTTTTNLRVSYIINSQSPVITQAFDGANAALFNPVQAIFTSRCVSCHSGPNPPAGLNLSAGNSWKNIVAMRSAEDPSRPRVSPGDDDRSYLYQKIIPGGNTASGTSRMPQGCAAGGYGPGCLSESDTNTVAQWINDGARPAQ